MSCALGIEQSCEEYRMCGSEKRQTNADRIRNMTNEELAEVIMCPYGSVDGLCNNEENCVKCCLEWLESEVSE